MHDIARTLVTRIASPSPIHLLVTNSTYRIHNTKNISERDAMIMSIDVYDVWKAKSLLMNDEIALNAYVRALIST
uniref:Uncharacterized protein n=1 Tax=Noccaea caerulescens TaxID=107243 RepID=A0A1J3JN50_NOCCA